MIIMSAICLANCLFTFYMKLHYNFKKYILPVVRNGSIIIFHPSVSSEKPSSSYCVM